MRQVELDKRIETTTSSKKKPTANAIKRQTKTESPLLGEKGSGSPLEV